MSEIRFVKKQIAVAERWLVEAIAEMAKIEPEPICIGKLSVVLAVLRKCREAAPED